ncbi:MAG: hypothetical protein DRP14_03335 [Candidatus Aenigmatarchaeota archaeon]|nr:MAG: hypothetical protein DRP14_03335 [Candidatus Aenigmarchaeota archaeon]
MYSKKIDGDNIAKAHSLNLRISVKNAKVVCKSVRGMYLKKAKKFLEDVLKEKRSINGKYYSKTTKEVLNIIKSAEKNAEFKNLDTDNMYILHIAALDGTHMYRRRRKYRFGTKIKSAHLEVILKEKTKKLEEKKIEKKAKKIGKEEKRQEKEIKEQPEEKERSEETEKSNQEKEIKEQPEEKERSEETEKLKVEKKEQIKKEN